MTDLINEAAAAADTAVSTFAKLKNAYVTGWPYWLPSIVIAAVLGHLV